MGRRLRSRLRWRIGFGWLAAWCDAEAGQFALWLPVFMGAGVLAYYSLRFEPPPWWGPVAVVPPLALAVFGRGWLRLAALPAAALALGFASAQVATARAPPIEAGLPFRATIVTGTIRAVEILPEGRRITLEAARLDDAATPLRRAVRIRLRKTDAGDFATGDTVRVRALVRPPSPPSYPGGWDLQRDAYYTGLGASGFALGPAERLLQAVPSAPLRLVQALREAIARRVSAVIPGAAGQVAVTLLTGMQTGIPEADHQAFRDSGLAHLLAVAGLHIGIVMGFFLAVSRIGFAASVHASLFWPCKQLTVVVALVAGAAYMVLTGMHVPIVRSFSMACLFTVAVLAGRNPVSLRGLGLAGAVLMLLAPQEVPGVSFQMSFSAVLALISGYEAVRPWLRRLQGKSRARRLASYVAALALTSALAGTASAPYGAYHFGHIQAYFILANMVAVPLTALWVMPAGLIALGLMPWGLDRLALVPMGWGAEAVVWVARTAAAWPAATVIVPHVPAWGLAVLSLGLAWLGLWRTKLRLAGLAAIVLGVISPALDHPPDLLLSADARLLGVRTEAGVFVQRTQGGSSFTRDAWLQYWAAQTAEPVPNDGTAAAGVIACAGGNCLLRPDRDRLAALLVRDGVRPRDCKGVSVIVSLEPARGLCPKPWPQLADRFTVWRDGSVAIWLRPGGAFVLTDRAERGARPWVPPPPTPHAKPPVSALPQASTDEAE
ncbi:MAG: ComEC/Rec2 family competence protein [Acetobacteraceae bacterium]|nr:ComEC/Rec2 family competence protein [Acetobacteraceae bacterium]